MSIFPFHSQQSHNLIRRQIYLCTLLFSLLLSMGSEAQANEAKEAERVRIVEDMTRMSRRGTWNAVDNKYKELLELGKDVALPEDHMLGATASFNMGRIEATCVRIQRTLEAIERLQDDAKYAELKVQAENWISQLRSTFVPVNISINRSYQGEKELKIAQLPFLPEEADALKRAQKMLEEKGEFRGMLPLGEYTIGDVSFSLQGQNVDVLTPMEEYRIFIKVPEPTKIKIAPRINLSGTLTSSNNITNTKELNAVAFQGVGFKTSAGIDVLMGKRFHLFTELGMHRFGKDGIVPDEIMNDYGFQPTDTLYSGYFGWFGSQIDISKIAISIGPTVEWAKISVQGAEKSSLPIETDFSAYVPMSGTIISSGLTTACTYRFISVGENSIGLSALANISNDSARWYTSYQLALTYSP